MREIKSQEVKQVSGGAYQPKPSDLLRFNYERNRWYVYLTTGVWFA